MEGVNKEEAIDKRDDDRSHLDNGGTLASDVLREDSKRETHQSTRERRHCDHQAGLCGSEMESLCDEGPHRAVEYPDREAEVEVEKGSEESGRMSRLEKCVVARHA